jgi:hypothetical protein
MVAERFGVHPVIDYFCFATIFGGPSRSVRMFWRSLDPPGCDPNERYAHGT